MPNSKITQKANEFAATLEPQEPEEVQTTGINISPHPDTVKSEITEAKDLSPTHSAPDDAKKSLVEQLKQIFASFFAFTKNGLVGVYSTTSTNLFKLYNFTLNTSKNGYSTTKNTMSSVLRRSLTASKTFKANHPLLTYNSLYVLSLGLLARSVQIYHEKYLVPNRIDLNLDTGEICSHCGYNDKLVQFGIPVAIAGSIMLVGNYLYLKKTSKKD